MTSVSFVIVVITSSFVGSALGGCTYGEEFICPPACTCSATQIICSNSKLTQIPAELPSTVEDIQMDHNHITGLYADDLANCSALQNLNLSFNWLTFVDESAFVDTVALFSLDLSRNELVVSELTNETFDSLSFLVVLEICYNSWQNDSYYNGRLFNQLTNLRALCLDGIANQSFPEEFSQLEDLEILAVTGGLIEITNTTFSVFKNSRITELTVKTGNHLIAVQPLSFAHFRHLRGLYLSGNRKLGFKNVANAWYGLRRTNISFLDLSSITAGSDETQRITGAFFRYLNQTNITVLFLSNNDLVHIEPLLSDNLRYLQKITLDGNRLINPTALMADLAKLRNLTFVLASYQSCPSDPFRNDGLQNFRTFKYNKIDKVLRYHQVSQEEYVSTCSTYNEKECKPLLITGQTVADSTLSSTNAESRPSLYDDMSPICISLPENIRLLNLSGGVFVNQQTLPPLTITDGGGKLESIELRYKGIRHINGPIIFTTPPQNLFVDLALNQIDCLHENVFKISYEAGAKITILQLSMNNLGPQLEHDTEGVTFQYYPFLEILFLNYNAIKKLHDNTFRNLTRLQELLLYGNALQDIEFEFAHMSELQLLDLSYNDLTFLSEVTLEKLEKSFHGYQNFTLSLMGNPLQCNCDTLSFLHWIDRNRRNLYSLDDTSCFYTKRNVNFSRLADYILVELEYECNKRTAVIVSGFLVGLVLILATLSAVCYRNRWEIRYAFIKLTQRGQRYQQLFAQLPHYDYDAFVVYDSEDRNWVNNELLPHLEQNTTATVGNENNPELIEVNQQGFHAGLRLCVHERDFTPGEDIIANIWNKMEKSRKVILVISNTFATSHYCDYELNLARMQSVEIGRNIIVPVLLDMPDIDRISEYLYWVLRKVTYLEWPQREEEQREFWRKLRRIIGDVDDDDDDDSY